MVPDTVEATVLADGEIRLEASAFPQGTRVRVQRLPAEPPTPPHPHLRPPTPSELAEGDRVVAEMRRRFRLTRFDDPNGPAAPPEEWDAVTATRPEIADETG